MSVSKRWDTSPRQRVVIETAPAGTMFEDINGNIGTVTRHGEHLTCARMYLHDGCWQGQRNNFSVISGPVVGQEPPLFGSSGPESTGP